MKREKIFKQLKQVNTNTKHVDGNILFFSIMGRK